VLKGYFLVLKTIYFYFFNLHFLESEVFLTCQEDLLEDNWRLLVFALDYVLIFFFLIKSKFSLNWVSFFFFDFDYFLFYLFLYFLLFLLIVPIFLTFSISLEIHIFSLLSLFFHFCSVSRRFHCYVILDIDMEFLFYVKSILFRLLLFRNFVLSFSTEIFFDDFVRLNFL